MSLLGLCPRISHTLRPTPCIWPAIPRTMYFITELSAQISVFLCCHNFYNFELRILNFDVSALPRWRFEGGSRKHLAHYTSYFVIAQAAHRTFYLIRLSLYSAMSPTCVPSESCLCPTCVPRMSRSYIGVAWELCRNSIGVALELR